MLSAIPRIVSVRSAITALPVIASSSHTKASNKRRFRICALHLVLTKGLYVISFYLNVGSNYHCLKFLNFQRVTVNLSLSTDLLFKVATVTSYFSMNSEGRMSFIEQVKESVEKAAEEMREFNESVRSTVIYKSMKGHNRKTYYQGRLAAFTRHTN